MAIHLTLGKNNIIGSKISDLANKALTVLTSPIGSIRNFSKAQSETAQKGALRLVGEGVENVLTVTLPIRAGAEALATNVLPKFATTKAAAATFIVGAVITSETVGKAIVDAPFNILTLGEKAGRYVEKIPEPVKEQISGAGITGLAVGTALYAGEQAAEAAGIRGGAGFVGTNPNKNQTKESPALGATEGLIGSPDLMPEAPQTQDISPKKRSKRRSKAQHQTISQIVNVRVNAGNHTNKYIKRVVYL